MVEGVEPDAADYTPERLLSEAVERVRADSNPPSKALLLLLWDDDNKYETQFFNAGLKNSEAVALLEVEKQRFLEMLLGEE